MVSPCGARIPKSMLLAGEKPLLANLFEELQKMQEFFERIIVVGSELKPYEEWMRFCLHDEFFKTKLSFVKSGNSQNFSDDVWNIAEWLSDSHLRPELAIVRPDIFWTDLSFLMDESRGSWRAYANGRALDLWKIEDFARMANAMIALNEIGKWSMDALTEKLQSEEAIGALDASGSMMPLETRKDFLDAVRWRESQKQGGAFAFDVDAKRQLIKISNAWKAKRWTPAVHLSEREAQSRLWDCWDFLDSCTPRQKPYLPAPVSRGPNVRGQYCNWIELQWLPDSSVEAMMLSHAMSEAEWRSIMDKALDILDESFWQEQEADWRSDADRKDRTRLVEELSAYWDDLVRERIPRFSAIKWQTVVSRHVEWLEDHVKNRKAVFHNGTGGRMVHGDLSLKNILCNWQTLDVHFVNPKNRTGVLVDARSEYAAMYADCWCLLPVFVRGRHVDCGPEGLDVPDFIADNAAHLEGILDIRLGEEAKEAKAEALMLALESMDEVPEEHRKAFLAFLHYRADELYVGSSGIARHRDEIPAECIGLREDVLFHCPKAAEGEFICSKMKRMRPHHPHHPHPCHCQTQTEQQEEAEPDESQTQDQTQEPSPQP